MGDQDSELEQDGENKVEVLFVGPLKKTAARFGSSKTRHFRLAEDTSQGTASLKYYVRSHKHLAGSDDIVHVLMNNS